MSQQLDLLWEDDLTIKRHPQARHVRVKVVPPGRVQVVVPTSFDTRELPQILAQHQDWIDRTIDRMRHDYRTAEALTAPQQVALAALEERWTVRCEPLTGSRASLRERSDGELLLLHEGDAWRPLLKRWLVRKAQAQLVPWLEQTSAEVGLPFAGATIRCQRSRWGSCSSRQQINLNVNLLFLPAEMVRYLFIHELCHTRHLDHSPRFWALVESKQPNYRAIDAEMRKANRLVPAWALPE